MVTGIGASVGVLRNVRFGPTEAAFLPGAELYDLVIHDGVVQDLAPAGNLNVHGASLDAEGRWAIPGLWDHHVHMSPWALRRSRGSLEGAASAAEAATIAAGFAPDANGLRVGMLLRDALWTDAPDLAVLDAATGVIPTYLINQDLHSVWCNSAALRREGITTSADGMLREAVAFQVASQLDAEASGSLDTLVDDALRAAASKGIVGVRDFDMAWNVGAWRRRAAEGMPHVRVDAGVYPADLTKAVQEGLRSGDKLDERGFVRVGPLKVITDGSLGTRTAACRHGYGTNVFGHGDMSVDPEQIVELMHDATGLGFAIAAHAIGDLAVSHVLDAFAATGASGSLEHAQLVAHADLQKFSRLGVTASVQPTHAVDDRDLADQEWSAQTSLAYPQRSLFDAGANVTFGSDAPVAPLDPWVAIADAVGRTNDGREPWHPEESVSVSRALAASTGRGSMDPHTLLPGAVADIALCDQNPFSAEASDLRAMSIGATLLAGVITHQSL